jgi:ParB-like chromosome segregation protein Spo0J
MTEETKLLKFKHVAVKDIIPYERNARTHSKKQISQIMKSIRKFGFTNPVVIDENNNLIAGHGRLEAAIALKMDKVPAVIRDGLTGTERRAMILGDNQIALKAGWDKDLLKEELEAIDADGFDIEDIGFDLDDLDSDDDDIDLPDAGGEFGIFIECADEKEQSNLFEELSKRSLKCKIMN